MSKRRSLGKSLVFCCSALLLSSTHGESLATHGHQQPAVAEHTGEVVVVGNKIDDFIQQNPSQVVSIGAAEIEKRNFLQVQDVLGSMAGVDVKASAGGLGTRVSIRGGGGSASVLVLVDGRPAATMQYGGVDLSSLPVDIIEKITVFKPPVPVWLGPDSAAGAIYIETKKKKKNTYGKKGKIRATVGSYGLATMSATGQLDRINSQYLVSGGLSHKDGKRENSQNDQGHLSIGYNRKEAGRELQVNTKAYISDHGIAGPTYNPTPDAEQRYEKASFDLKYKGSTDRADYTLKGWTDVKRLDETSQNGDGSKLDTATAGFGTDFFVSGDDSDNELRVGGQIEHNWVDHTLSGEHDRNTLSIHSEYSIRHSVAVYTLGGRADYTDDFDVSPGAHAGIAFDVLDTLRIKANVGYSEHIPTFGQLYQPSHGAIDQVRGNPDLDRERIISSSLGLEQDILDRHTFSFSLFRTDSMDLIKYQRDDNNISTPLNIDQASKQGIETTFKYVVSDSTDMELSYILQDTENKDNGKYLSYAPTHSLKCILKTQFVTQTRLEWTTRGYSKQYSDNENSELERLDAYVTTDIRLSQPVSLFKKQALFFADIHNLFDEQYSSHYGYPDDGIKLTAGVSVNF